MAANISYSSSMRIIKKYPNRRLYDTETKAYITLEEIKTLVLQGKAFQVLDSKTQEDMTNYVLLQVIAEQESRGQPILTTNILRGIIRFYGTSLQGNFSQFLENLFHTFTQQSPTDLQQHFKNLNQLAVKNMELWQQTWQKFFDISKRKP